MDHEYTVPGDSKNRGKICTNPTKSSTKAKVMFSDPSWPPGMPGTVLSHPVCPSSGYGS